LTWTLIAVRATSNRKLAEALGVSEAAVRNALAAGRIGRDPDGGFDVGRVKRQSAGNTDAAQQRPAAEAGLRPVPAAALASVRERLRESGDPGGAEPIATGGPSFPQAWTANEVLKEHERKPSLSQLKGELIDRARVATDLAAELVPEPQTVQTALEAAVKAHLAELAELKPRFD
jgi:hypothetical protein